MLSILGGHLRYAHIAAIRGDTVAPNEVHDELPKRAQKAQILCAKTWMLDILFDSVQHSFEQDWISVIDPTVKVLYGNQSAAEIGYNPEKPCRSSHTIRIYWISVLRLVIGAELQDGISGRDRTGCENGFDELKINGVGEVLVRKIWSAPT